jgi:sarcosine oxidase subunit alpha
MSGAGGRRLPGGGRIDRAQPIAFRFNGKTHQGFAGDTLASALMAQGVQLVARSWKYHRPRGILSAGVEEPNALVQLFEGARTVPNARMTEVPLVPGLAARSIHAHPSLEWDWRAINNAFSRFLPAGFYYKTFMASQKVWHYFERHIRQASGLGEAPSQPDPEHYERRFEHCDVLIAGAGLAGLCAALAAAESGARVVLADEQNEMGGWLLASDAAINGQPASQWLRETLATLRALPEVRLLARTTVFGYQDHNLLTLAERRTDHLPAGSAPPGAPRECLWKVRARQVVLAAGAHERPLVFANNDLPGVMLASAVTTYIRRYAVLPGHNAVVFTNNDAAYECAMALHSAGAQVRVVDARSHSEGGLVARAKAMGIAVMQGHVVTQADGGKCVRSVQVHPLNANGQLGPAAAVVMPCDVLAVSGGFSPVMHLYCQSGAKAAWHEGGACFVPGTSVQAERSAGACRLPMDLAGCAQDGWRAGQDAAQQAGFAAAAGDAPQLPAMALGELLPLWEVPHPAGTSRAPKKFVDFQNDVAASDIHLALREGFESIEHIKRYTAMGFGTDQGKTSNINGMGIAAQLMGKPIPAVGTTTFRPNYTPVTFGLLAGGELGDLFDPIRTTAMHDWHLARGAMFEDVGQWKRPWYYPQPGEDLHAAVRRECLAVRNSVGTLDASTLGKIDIQGPDASTLLNWLYSNAWSKLGLGKCRYGLMLDENGMVFDDGVTVRLGEQHYLMHTTSGGAARVLAWMENWLQTEWPHLKVYLTSVTDHWATTAVVGPKARALLEKICSDVDFDEAAFPFMSCREGTVAGVAARIMRISFSGELSYEVNVAASEGLAVWQAIQDAGAEFGITPYGTESMHVLRAEKGYIIVGQDTDGSMSPVDLGMGGMVSATKDFLGKRSLSRSDTRRSDRKQLVGLLSADPLQVLPEGAAIADSAFTGQTPHPMLGHVTSSYLSPILGHAIALAVVQSGHARLGQSVVLPLRDGRNLSATIVSPVFYDPQSERQHA